MCCQVSTVETSSFWTHNANQQILLRSIDARRRQRVHAKPALTRRMASIGGIVVAVSLLAVSVAAVFGTDQVGLLEG